MLNYRINIFSYTLAGDKADKWWTSDNQLDDDGKMYARPERRYEDNHAKWLHSCGDWPTIFTRDSVPRENHWLGTNKSLFTAPHIFFYMSYINYLDIWLFIAT